MSSKLSQGLVVGGEAEYYAVQRQREDGGVEGVLEARSLARR